MGQSRMDTGNTGHIHTQDEDKQKHNTTLKTKKTGDIKYTSLKLVKKMRKRTSHL